MSGELPLSSVERDVNKLFQVHGIHTAKPIDLASIKLPNSPVAESVLKFASSDLDQIMFNHSMRVYYFGAIVVQDQFPDWKWDNLNETYYHTALLHDIGVGPKHHLNTRLSFEFFGGLMAHEFLLKHGAPLSVADDVTEAIIRHTNFVDGQIRYPGQLIQLATTLDVIGANPQLYHPETIENIVTKYPRIGFNQHFARLMDLEMEKKPGCHTTALLSQNFVEKIRVNPVMKKYDA